MEHEHKRKKKSDKGRKTFDKYGKNTSRGVRIKETENENRKQIKDTKSK
jgi:hypothetical protein